jgi:MoaA/NifB/PqqE/SkfB family radical SAM enzyme
MCNIVAANSGVTEYDPKHTEQIARNLSKIGVGVVLLTGGEPFLRNDIADIVKIFIRRQLEVRLQTAGLTSRLNVIRRCLELGARDINVSLDTLDEDLHDHIRGVKGSWRKAVETVSAIENDFPKVNALRALGCVLSPLNIDHVESVLRFAREIGWHLSLVPVHLNRPDENYHFRGGNPEFAFKPEDAPRVEALIQRLKWLKKSGYPLYDSRPYLDSIITFIKEGRPSWRKNDVCDAGGLYFAIRPDGRYAPCCDNDYGESLYVYDADFPEIFRSKEFLEKNRAIARRCSGCNFGSYPEMTLTMRHFPSFFERACLQIHGGRAGRNSKITGDPNHIFEIIDEIKRTP